MTTVTGPVAWANIDPYLEESIDVVTTGGNITTVVANPADAETLAKLKRETGNHEPLLASDANSVT